MTFVYIVNHLDLDTLDDGDNEKLIGVYSSLDLAERAVAQLRDKPGFRDFPEKAWYISPHELDSIVDYWDEGFF
ncbi:MAG: hypothetical protein EPO55_15685 [Reyranella sp.]|uniref:DUF7336 domain-containing protein n=1 Tax=Reyranella sp. TaxID=1929291 RepID=UPI0012113700|nr:hypothetical protein [Reyranella sp.]TAJ38432.1 MAG: hypothetical protein EPO55_15685 [Reyranella sp.]